MTHTAELRARSWAGSPSGPWRACPWRLHCELRHSQRSAIRAYFARQCPSARAGAGTGQVRRPKSAPDQLGSRCPGEQNDQQAARAGCAPALTATYLTSPWVGRGRLAPPNSSTGSANHHARVLNRHEPTQWIDSGLLASYAVAYRLARLGEPGQSCGATGRRNT